MKRQFTKPPKVALCRVCHGTGYVQGPDYEPTICRKLYAALDGLEGNAFNGMAIIETATNHNHEVILESIDTYAVRFLLAE